MAGLLVPLFAATGALTAPAPTTNVDGSCSPIDNVTILSDLDTPRSFVIVITFTDGATMLGEARSARVTALPDRINRFVFPTPADVAARLRDAGTFQCSTSFEDVEPPAEQEIRAALAIRLPVTDPPGWCTADGAEGSIGSPAVPARCIYDGAARFSVAAIPDELALSERTRAALLTCGDEIDRAALGPVDLSACDVAANARELADVSDPFVRLIRDELTACQELAELGALADQDNPAEADFYQTVFACAEFARTLAAS